MPSAQNWHDMVISVQNANLDKQRATNNLHKKNKQIYRSELDKQIQFKNSQVQYQQKIKQAQLLQIKRLVDNQKKRKQSQKRIKQQIEKKYGNENMNIIRNKKVRASTLQQQKSSINQYLQHPFIRLVDGQDSRNENLRKKFIKQNQINQIQQEIKKQTKNQQQTQDKKLRQGFINFIQSDFKKRIDQRQAFKSKYLKIKKDQLPSNSIFNPENQSLGLDKSYILYLNQQIKQSRQRKTKQHSEKIGRKEQNTFMNTQPDSSPAYLGRNSINHDRRRQLYYVTKHLNTNHHVSLTENISQINMSNIHRQRCIINRAQSQSTKAMNMSFEQQQLLRKRGKIQEKNNFSVQLRPSIHNIISQPDSFKHQQKKNKTIQQQKNIQPIFASESSNRRIKSQFSQAKQVRNQKSLLPVIANVKQKYQKHIVTAPKKQYTRYDLISGKNVYFYI